MISGTVPANNITLTTSDGKVTCVKLKCGEIDPFISNTQYTGANVSGWFINSITPNYQTIQYVDWNGVHQSATSVYSVNSGATQLIARGGVLTTA